MNLYGVNAPGGRLVASRTVEGVPQLLEQLAPGRYLIEEVTFRGSLRAPRLRDWGWAIKQGDGQVILQRSDEPSEVVPS
jgi:hypothetical protein